ncbi:MAG: hypothetical protein ACYTF0_05465, partial [Planctomycetota bacterium]
EDEEQPPEAYIEYHLTEEDYIEDDDGLGLLQTIDFLPEEDGRFAGLGYQGAAAPPAGDTSAAPVTEAPLNTDYLVRLSAALALILLSVWLIRRYVRCKQPHPVIVGAVLLITIFLAKDWVLPPAASGETDVQEEAFKIRDLGVRFVAEEAAREADAMQAVLEDLRLIKTIQQRSASTERDELHVQRLLKRIHKLTGEHIDLGALDERITAIDAEQRKWRNLQQKLGQMELGSNERRLLIDLVGRVLDGHGGKISNLERHRAILSNQLENLRSTLAIRDQLGITASSGPDLRLVAAIDLSDGNRYYSTTTGGELITWQNEITWINDEIKTFARRIVDEVGDDFAYDPSPYSGSAKPDAWWSDTYLHPAALTNLICNSVTISTVNDSRVKVGTPRDSAANFQTDNFLAQTRGLTSFVTNLIASGAGGSKRGGGQELVPVTLRIEQLSQGSALGTKGSPYPFVALDYLETSSAFHGDVRPSEFRWGDAFGEVRHYYIPNKIPSSEATFPLRVYAFAESGNISHTLVSQGTQFKSSTINAYDQEGGIFDLLLQVFRCETSNVYGIFDPRLLSELPTIKVLSATREAPPNQAHFELDQGAAAVFAPPGIGLRVLATVGQAGNRMLLLGDHVSEDQFIGLEPGGLLSTEPVSGGREPVPTALANARDQLMINKSRLDVLQNNGISPERLWTLQAEGQRRLEAADAALESGDSARAEGLAQAAWSYLGRVYPEVLGTANDVVYGLVVMLLIAIPFAVICERLLVSANTIVGKVMGFIGFFISTFLFFFFFHPAFSLATTPVIIFLAFAIVTMAALVICIIYQRFEQEMEQLRMAGMGTHKADVGRLGTILATGQLGISNMRRRPLRTFLTGITVVLMTFILLTFASFGDQAGSRRITKPLPPQYDGIMVRQNGWSPLAEDTVNRIADTWQDDLHGHERRWLMGSAQRIRFPFNGPSASDFVLGVLGVTAGDPVDLNSCLIRDNDQRGFGDNGEGWIFLPADKRANSGYAIGDTMLFQGLSLRVGAIDEDRLAGITTLDGDPITPINASAMSPQQLEAMEKQAEKAGGGGASAGGVSHLSPANVAIMHAATLKRIGGDLRAISLTAKHERVAIDQVAEDMAQQLATTLRVGTGGETFLLTAIDQM